MQSASVHIQEASLCFVNKTVFSNLNFCLPAKRWVALLGPSGIGKSSLLRMIAGLPNKEAVMSGHIYADYHQPVSDHIAYMAQTDLLLPWLTVLNNAMLSFKLNPSQRKNYLRHLETAKTLLNKAGLGESMQLYPHQLSGGMRQRVALVRTFMQNKPIVLMDEPFSALDAINRYKLQDMAATWLQDKTVFFITHDPSEAARLAHEIYVMQGNPSCLKHIVTLNSPTPRALDDQTLISLQTSLYKELDSVE